MFFHFYSLLWAFKVRLRGGRVGKNFKTSSFIDLLLRDGASCKNLEIGDDVQFAGSIYFRLRAGGKIKISNDVKLGTDVWLVVANDATLEIESHVQIGSYCILNGGHGITVGRDSWLAAFVYVNSSDHNFRKGVLIRTQGFSGAPISIGQDNWIGGHAFISKGITTGNGVVVGAGTILTKNFPDNAIVVGNPGKLLKYRED